MNILVVGCGKVGSKLASVLSREGHDVSIVDREEENFDLLDDDFAGFKTRGVPIDQDVLRHAGIENCDALAAVSQDDNVNIMVSELAREIFHIPTVVARVYDPARENVFSEFGLQTICPTNLTVAAIRSAIVEKECQKSVNIQSHTITFSTQTVSKAMEGTNAAALSLDEKKSLYGILHADNSVELFHGQKMRLTEGDKMIISTFVD